MFTGDPWPKNNLLKVSFLKFIYQRQFKIVTNSSVSQRIVLRGEKKILADIHLKSSGATKWPSWELQ